MYKKNSSGWAKHIDFILLDLLCVQLAFYISYVIRQGDWNPYVIPIYRHMSIFIEFANLMIIFLLEAYKNVLKRGYYKEAVSSIKQSFMLLLVCSLYLITLQDGNDYSRISLFMMGGLYGLLTYIIRLFWKRLLRHRMKIGGNISLVIITTSNIAEEVICNIKKKNYDMYKINGVIILDKDMRGTIIEGVQVVSNAENAARCLLQMWVDEVFINLDEKKLYPKELIDRCTEMALTIHLNLAKISNDVGENQLVERIGNYIVLTTSLNVMTLKQAVLKRSIDIVAGICGCIATGIIFIFIAPIIYISSPGPIFYSQERVGRNGKIFRLYKFRSMYLDAEERKAELMKDNKMNGNLMFKIDFDPRVIGNKILPDGTKKTGIGQFIRSTSLDEFPQFMNILLGHMSLVGYRPALPSEYNQYKFHHRVRISMKPGLTGMWQVSGRSNITDFEEVVELDKKYIRNWSMGLDFRIIFKTISTVLHREGSM
ncbi:exopolysaccharide biosynthesis polyprenyl glycosylphosphotransferase [Enterococcus faecium]|uniref:exopolysaccharide biosynthesis polyprenyl glycosylphosphotransferase n=1 Tax=Enterococcus faecium TaxID=1352 RepID=UPI0021D3518D|nr:exopolysaccharide biosynthesis polyprenyl glycosylphosphotransferase [Enterococcus faecium]MCU4679268.1 exopolysaccharide biosynthesis polyprenyl glycosylphosphotransferase [Enterococcus faecium]